MTRSGSAPESIAPAIGHVKTMLFQPFDIGRWVTLGFVSFLAYLGQGGYSFNYSNPWSKDDQSTAFIRGGVSWAMDHRALTAAILFVVILIGLVLTVLFQWLSARGTFIYIDCAARNRAEVKRPWKEHREIADSFFFWRLIFGLCVGLLLLPEL